MKNKRSDGKILGSGSTTMLSLCNDENMASGILMGFWSQIAHDTAAIQSRGANLGHVQVGLQSGIGA